MQFRKDINGLRAIAVIAVVLFHFNPTWMPGGFAGVDVFFVISGFLMTGIIFRGLDQNNFSILKFYVARANRIIPALALLCFVLLILGWFYLSPLDYRTLGYHIASSVGFVSNIVYWMESGYFNATSIEKWLLHTWSLSAEWQFYIIYPLVLVTLKKWLSLNVLKHTILVGTILGFMFCVVATYKWPDPSYFLLPTRAWEMMIGGVAYLYPFRIQESRKGIVEWTGLVLIIGSYFFISKYNAWPGYYALFPVLGSFLVIQAQRNNSIITNNLIFQKLGAWSYSIYLWHWPLVVTIYYFSLDENFIYLGLALSVLFGFLSNKYVEKIRFTNNISSFTGLFRCKPVYIMIFVGILGSLTYSQSGFLFRLSDDLQLKNINAMTAVGDWGYPSANLKVGEHKVRLIKGSGDKNILFIGASHIEHTYPYSEALNTDYNIYYVTTGGCFIAKSYVNPTQNCANIQDYESLFSEIKFEKVVTSIYTLKNYLSSDEDIRKKQIALRVSEYDEFLRYAKAQSKEVFIVLGEPVGPEFDPMLSVRKDLKDYVDVSTVRETYEIHYEALTNLKELEGITVIDPVNYLCTDICKVMDDNFNFYYKDKTHMRPWYAQKALGYLDIVFDL
ncbi:MAG: acyltransferase family protein [Paraglaciecola sp.]|uniref:acyltransferase family protein n=3 Tax=Paraglaciecola sp. TaxID=1920173 RepID=UPI003263668B